MSAITSSGSETSYGRIKAPPVCRVAAFKKDALSVEQLNQMCFSVEDISSYEALRAGLEASSLASSPTIPGTYSSDTGCSSQKSKTTLTCIMKPCTESNTDINDDDKKIDVDNTVCKSKYTAPITNLDTSRITSADTAVAWDAIKNSVLGRTESRNGRDLQRFDSNKRTNQPIRLTTGCVPVMADGKVLLVSSSRKEEWILPKGGWESDESMELSALRECFEESGVLGTLGPRLTDVEYETRKAKKRRLELQALKKKNEKCVATTSNPGLVNASSNVQNSNPEPSVFSSGNSVHSISSSHCFSEDETLPPAKSTTSRAEVSSSPPQPAQSQDKDKEKNDTPSPTSIHPSKECLATKIRNSIAMQRNISDKFDDTASIASIASSDQSSSCMFVRMSMFPLYVLEVRDKWPECGRARKVVDIDVAIEMMDSRPEFQQVLIEVKNKGYHLVPRKSQNLHKS
mmetsp:Transcript_8070/g.11527  ORF Transcript_8070/g.11527 Transcript_8070/m.11527 type:complete len:458 (-) Transcript_8070:89-1462(-)